VTSSRTILLISGSLRHRSTNTAVLRSVHDSRVPDVRTVLYEGLGDLPHFNPDDDVAPLPPAVASLREAIRAADAVVFCTPEYAGALPGSFKNLLDWTVGDDQVGSIYRKPVAWINASTRGAANAHDELRTVLGYVGATVVDGACVRVPVTAAMLDDDGLVADVATRDAIARAVRNLAAHRTTGRLRTVRAF
jgi:NAD(P)H-dependent FMN reductase